jgi:hypothetical protein
MMIRPIVFIGETKLTEISDDSVVRVMIQISLPPVEADDDELIEARNVLIETYKEMARDIAQYLGAVQYELMQDPMAGLMSAETFLKHIENAVKEVNCPFPEYDTDNNEPDRREFLISYQ